LGAGTTVKLAALVAVSPVALRAQTPNSPTEAALLVVQLTGRLAPTT
jgi:hypothetical protein